MTAALLDPVAKAEYYYDYAGDDPINNIDPSGMSWWSDIRDYVGGAAAIAVGAVTVVGGAALGTACLAGTEGEPAGLLIYSGAIAAGGSLVYCGIRKVRHRECLPTRRVTR